jgi:hypothetical protein
MMTRSSRRRWSVGAIVGIGLGALILVAGDRSGHHGVRLLGAIIMAGGCLCTVIRVARDSDT